MDEARAVLGVAAGATAADERSAFRRRLRATHPDVAGPRADAGIAVARLTRALAVLRSARTGGAPPPRPAPPPGGAAAPAAPAPTAEPAGDSLLLDVPADEAFLVLLEAAHAVGEVTYVDARLGLVEAVLADGGHACQLLITLQGRATHTEAFCTLEPLGTTPCPPTETVVADLVAALTGAR
ncbi:MAG TPA: J domain-containing protein [Acidimicrobiales bacterium]|nr:J domain-containing protein [Acidimicrobiales bacterium]